MNVRRVSEAKSISKGLFSICSVLATFAPFRVISAVLTSSVVIPGSVASRGPAAFSPCPHRHSVISGMSSPCLSM